MIGDAQWLREQRRVLLIALRDEMTSKDGSVDLKDVLLMILDELIEGLKPPD